MKKSTGFTLIELMIVGVVVAILAAIALPGYQDFVRKSRRADVLSKLLDVQVQQEKWRINNPKYAVTSASVGSPTSEYYSFAVVATTNAYTIVVTPIANKGQSGDKQYGTNCGIGLFIDESKRGHYTSTPNTASYSSAQSNKSPSSPTGTTSECWRK